MIRPMLRKSFWTRRNTSTGNLPSTDSKDDENRNFAFELRSKWKFKGKPKDPFSITAALATIDDVENSGDTGSHGRSLNDVLDSSIEHSRPTKAYQVPSRASHGEDLIMT